MNKNDDKVNLKGRQGRAKNPRRGDSCVDHRTARTADAEMQQSETRSPKEHSAEWRSVALAHALANCLHWSHCSVDASLMRMTSRVRGRDN